jgi:hypothetical protein
LPSYRISGLTCEQLDELAACAEDFLEEPWDKETGRPKALCLRDALIVTCGYMRNNITEEVWAEIFDVSQWCISRYIKTLTPVVADAMKDHRPTAEDAAEATQGAIALVDGTLWPCWSWSGAKDLWAGKYKTTGHGSLIITNYDGDILYVSDPVTGNRHDMGKLSGSEPEGILKAAGGVFGDKGFIGTDYITTPIRKPEHRELYIREKKPPGHHERILMRRNPARHDNAARATHLTSHHHVFARGPFYGADRAIIALQRSGCLQFP